MPQINFEGSGHVPSRTTMVGTSLVLQPFPRLTALEPLAHPDVRELRRRDNQMLAKLRAAMQFISVIVAPCQRCNDYFRSLRPQSPVTFARLWGNPGIWINFFSSSSVFGVTSLDGRDIGISNYRFDGSWRQVAATIVHEFAHVAGAPGGVNGPLAAEDSLLYCLFADLHDPNARG